MTDDNNSNNDDNNTPKKTVAEPMSFTISGTQGGKARLEIQTNQGPIEGEFVLDEKKEEPDLNAGDMDYEPEILGLRVQMKFNFEGPCPEGIDGGRIVRMIIIEGERGDENVLAHFDDGRWKQEAETPLAIQAKMNAQKEYNGLEMPDVKPAFDHTKKHIPKP